jgi:hypothetical protein
MATPVVDPCSFSFLLFFIPLFSAPFRYVSRGFI